MADLRIALNDVQLLLLLGGLQILSRAKSWRFQNFPDDVLQGLNMRTDDVEVNFFIFGLISDYRVENSPRLRAEILGESDLKFPIEPINAFILKELPILMKVFAELL